MWRWGQREQRADREPGVEDGGQACVHSGARLATLPTLAADVRHCLGKLPAEGWVICPTRCPAQAEARSQRITAAPAEQIAAPAMSQRSGLTPSTPQSQSSEAMM